MPGATHRTDRCESRLCSGPRMCEPDSQDEVNRDDIAGGIQPGFFRVCPATESLRQRSPVPRPKDVVHLSLGRSTERTDLLGLCVRISARPGYRRSPSGDLSPGPPGQLAGPVSCAHKFPPRDPGVADPDTAPAPELAACRANLPARASSLSGLRGVLSHSRPRLIARLCRRQG